MFNTLLFPKVINAFLLSGSVEGIIVSCLIPRLIQVCQTNNKYGFGQFSYTRACLCILSIYNYRWSSHNGLFILR